MGLVAALGELVETGLGLLATALVSVGFGLLGGSGLEMDRRVESRRGLG